MRIDQVRGVGLLLFLELSPVTLQLVVPCGKGIRRFEARIVLSPPHSFTEELGNGDRADLNAIE